MKIATVLTLALLMVFAIGCSSDKTAAPTNSTAPDFDIIGNDAPATVQAALDELNDLSISVPDPVQPGDPALAEGVNIEAATTVITNATLDDSARVRFRAIVAHLHDQMQTLRACMANHPDPRLRRLAYGAAHAIQFGLRALQNGEPREALRAFHVANRVLNRANALCSSLG